MTQDSTIGCTIGFLSSLEICLFRFFLCDYLDPSASAVKRLEEGPNRPIYSDVPKGVHGGHDPSLSAFGSKGAPQASGYFFQRLDTTSFTRGKIDMKDLFMCLWLPEGPLDDKMDPCSHPRASGIVGTWSPRRPW